MNATVLLTHVINTIAVEGSFAKRRLSYTSQMKQQKIEPNITTSHPMEFVSTLGANVTCSAKGPKKRPKTPRCDNKSKGPIVKNVCKEYVIFYFERTYQILNININCIFINIIQLISTKFKPTLTMNLTPDQIHLAAYMFHPEADERYSF